MEQRTTPFGEKLHLALRALTLTRGQIAAELGLDKSAIGRWERNATVPSAHNLARLSAMIARSVHGFTLLDWDLPLDELAAVLRGERQSAPAEGGFGREGGLPSRFMGQIRARTALLGAVYEGFYRSTRPFGRIPGRFLHDHCMVRKDRNGLLRLTMATGGVFVDGWVLLMQDQLFIIGDEFTNGGLVFALLNGVVAARAEVLDGIVLSPIFDTERTPTASAIVLERIGELTGDSDVDDAHFATLAAMDPMAPDGSVPEAMRQHLTRDFGAGALAAGGDWLLRMPMSRTIDRGRNRPL